MSPKETGAPWSGSANGGGEFGQELKRAHEHQNSKMAAESAAGSTAGSFGSGGGSATGSSVLASAARAAASGVPAAAAVALSPKSPVPNRAGDKPPDAGSLPPQGLNGLGTPTAAALEGDSAKATMVENPDSPMPERSERELSVDDDGHAVPPAAPPADDASSENDAGGGAGALAVSDGEISEPADAGDDDLPELEPGKVRVRALYDYEATQDGDLSFLAGDIIVTDRGAFSGDGWVSGDCHGKTGIFPANYTEPF